MGKKGVEAEAARVAYRRLLLPKLGWKQVKRRYLAQSPITPCFADFLESANFGQRPYIQFNEIQPPSRAMPIKKKLLTESAPTKRVNIIAPAKILVKKAIFY